MWTQILELNIKKLEVYLLATHSSFLFVFATDLSNLIFLTWNSWSPSSNPKTYVSISGNGNSILPVAQAMIWESPLTPFFFLYSNIQMISISYWFYLYSRSRTQSLLSSFLTTFQPLSNNHLWLSLLHLTYFGLPASLLFHVVCSQKSSQSDLLKTSYSSAYLLKTF